MKSRGYYRLYKRVLTHVRNGEHPKVTVYAKDYPEYKQISLISEVTIKTGANPPAWSMLPMGVCPLIDEKDLQIILLETIPRLDELVTMMDDKWNGK